MWCGSTPKPAWFRPGCSTALVSSRESRISIGPAVPGAQTCGAPLGSAGSRELGDSCPSIRARGVIGTWAETLRSQEWGALTCRVRAVGECKCRAVRGIATEWVATGFGRPQGTAVRDHESRPAHDGPRRPSHARGKDKKFIMRALKR